MRKEVRSLTSKLPQVQHLLNAHWYRIPYPAIINAKLFRSSGKKVLDHESAPRDLPVMSMESQGSGACSALASGIRLGVLGIVLAPKKSCQLKQPLISRNLIGASIFNLTLLEHIYIFYFRTFEERARHIPESCIQRQWQ